MRPYRQEQTASIPPISRNAKENGIVLPMLFHNLALASLGLAVVCAVFIVVDEIGRPQPMVIMSIVWPVCALFGSVLILAAYLGVGRAKPVSGSPTSQHSHDHRHHHASHQSSGKAFAVAVGKGALHCGSGCTLGDIVAEWLAFFFPALAVVFGWQWAFDEKIFAVWVLDFVLAFGFGVAFQYFAIKPMRDISVREGIVAALKADTASLLSWQIGMYGFMALAHFWFFPDVLGQALTTQSVEFWFVMQLAMLCGFVTAYPVNWGLIRIGVKEAM